MWCSKKVYVFLGEHALTHLVPVQPIFPFIILIKEMSSRRRVGRWWWGETVLEFYRACVGVSTQLKVEEGFRPV